MTQRNSRPHSGSAGKTGPTSQAKGTPKAKGPSKSSRGAQSSRGAGSSRAKQSAQPADARASALAALDEVLQKGRPLEEALAGQPGYRTLAVRDRAFARRLLAGTLRHLGQIDDLLSRLLERPLGVRNRRATNILRLGVCQLAFLETPAHAAVSTALSLAEHPHSRSLKGLVNAVLRRLDREKDSLLAEQDAARLNLPAWLWDRLEAAYGEADLRASLAVQLQEPPLDLTVREPREEDELARSLEAQVLPVGGLRLPSGRGEVTALSGYAEGRWWVQDAAAALPARLAGEVKGRRVYDLCAAPGGKTCQLAAGGGEVTAVDLSGPRLKRLQENLVRLGLRAEVVTADVATWEPAEAADVVLLDAPCSSTGTLRRHPDVAWLKREEDIPGLCALQDRLLAAAAKLVAPGGLLIYAICSLLPEEGPERIAAFLQEHGEFTRVPVTAAEVGDRPELLTQAGELRSLPCHLAELGGLDGFYACRLRRS
ncbi:16S rRNA (cytosine(967)-C(5))-methyltransferase RsmB [Fodinicurvata sediminis]|uniref:16S rRNA (cytosine(967)-C(5))-methyltransferase RsmB n=1 Tax=Fodinicurvata sediminis TaxID=1121832 RepID=UPI0003B30AB4|nr:16S rRNA (cytosine(967)-C(5))-methyltransferase RsmB [Fodinicurvata sediminis]